MTWVPAGKWSGDCVLLIFTTKWKHLHEELAACWQRVEVSLSLLLRSHTKHLSQPLPSLPHQALGLFLHLSCSRCWSREVSVLTLYFSETHLQARWSIHVSSLHCSCKVWLYPREINLTVYCLLYVGRPLKLEWQSSGVSIDTRDPDKPLSLWLELGVLLSALLLQYDHPHRDCLVL